MKKCKDVIDGTVIPTCGQNICCFFCDQKDSCTDKCVDVKESCPEQVDEETELQIMQEAIPEALQKITDITIQIKRLKQQESIFRTKLLETMERCGVQKFENDEIIFTYVAPTTRTILDSAKLKKLYPDIAEECSKVSNVLASVRIKVK